MNAWETLFCASVKIDPAQLFWAHVTGHRFISVVRLVRILKLKSQESLLRCAGHASALSGRCLSQNSPKVESVARSDVSSCSRNSLTAKVLPI